MAEIHKRGHIKGEPNNPVCNCNGTTYFNCGSNCECCDTGQLTGDRVANNPSDPRSFGFNNNYDGRVRGGVKTPQAFDKRNSIVGREFNIFDRNERKNNFVKNASMNTTQNQGVNVNPNRNNGRTTRIVKKHPLDLLRQKRVMGATVYDPVTKVYKVDDLRPRGWDEVGKVACWGKCKIKRPWWQFGLGGGNVSCSCNKAGNSCKCDGCLGGAT